MNCLRLLGVVPLIATIAACGGQSAPLTTSSPVAASKRAASSPVASAGASSKPARSAATSAVPVGQPLRPNDLFPYQGSGLIFQTARLNAPDGAELARRVVPAMVEAVQRLHSDKEFAIKVLQKYTQGVSDDVAGRTWDYAVPSAPSDGRPTKEGMQLVIDDLQATYPGKTLPTADSLLDLTDLDQSK